jgi:hypothetical protein
MINSQFLAFLKIKLARDHKEFYIIGCSQQDFEDVCPRSASDFDALTASCSGKPIKEDCHGQLGRWMSELGIAGGTCCEI